MRPLGMPSKALTPISLTGLGSSGLNTQAQESTLGPEWLTETDNIVFDLQGRIASRKGIQQVSKTVANPVKSLAEYIKTDRSKEYFASSGSAIYKIDTSTTPNTLTAQSFQSSPQTISNSNWQWVNFNDELWGVQSGHKPINYDGTNWYDVEDLGAYAANSGVTTFNPSCALGEFGRMWYGGITESPGVLYYSDNLIGEKLNGGASGSVDLKTVWGTDEIVALAALMNKIIIFGKENIVIYEGASNPASMVLDEVIKGTGLAGRNNLVYIATDIIFLSYEGLMSLGRLTATDGKAPIQDLSITIRTSIAQLLSGTDVDDIDLTYFREAGIAVLFVPNEKLCYIFDFTIKSTMPKITKWTFTTAPLCGLSTIDGIFYIGTSTGVSKYINYQDSVITDTTSSNGTEGACNTAGGTWHGGACWLETKSNYSYTFSTSWLTLDNPVISKIIKSGVFTITGGRGAASTITLFKDFDTTTPYAKTFNLAAAGSVFLYGKPDALYGSAKYGNQSGPSDYKISLGRTGKTIKLKMVTEVNGNYSSLINTTLLTKQGKIR